MQSNKSSLAASCWSPTFFMENTQWLRSEKFLFYLGERFFGKTDEWANWFDAIWNILQKVICYGQQNTLVKINIRGKREAVMVTKSKMQ